MIEVNKLGILLSKSDLPFECDGVLNPGVIKVDNKIHLFYRAVTKNNYSTIGYCLLAGPNEVEIRNSLPLLYPQFDYEEQGMEDPRVVKIEETYYLTYTAYDGVNALGALATSVDLVNWTKVGLVAPCLTFEEFKRFIEMRHVISEKYIRYNVGKLVHHKKDKKVYVWDKNMVLFPRKIDGKICFLHRIKPDIQLVVSVGKLDELTPAFWDDYFMHFDEHIVLSPRFDHEVRYIGSGCPPIETGRGWLMIYHGVRDTIDGYVYSACAALLDLKNPRKEIARLPYPLFFPEKDWELKGEVNNVCFPTGALVEDGILFIYYGAADERIAVASVVLEDLVEELLQYKTVICL
jgi:predicted GH43/DUF377 family glycosyl hydrolase